MDQATSMCTTSLSRMTEQMLPAPPRFKDPNPCTDGAVPGRSPVSTRTSPFNLSSVGIKDSRWKGGCSTPRTAHEMRHGSTDVDDDLALTVTGLDQGVRLRDLSKREPCADDRIQLPCLDQTSQGYQTCVAGLHGHEHDAGPG